MKYINNTMLAYDMYICVYIHKYESNYILVYDI